MPQAGRLRWRIRIEQRNATQNSIGEPIVSWTTVADNVPAQILGQSGRSTFREFFGAQQVQNNQLVEINIRFRPGIVEGMRVVRLSGTSPAEDGEVLSIEGLMPDNTAGNRWLTMMCRKRLPTGFRNEGLR